MIDQVKLPQYNKKKYFLNADHIPQTSGKCKFIVSTD